MLGVDPDGRMAELARSSGLDVEVAKFEEWDAGDRTFDAVIAAQAWHWVDPVAGAAKAAAVLGPGGGSRSSGTRSSRQRSCARPSVRCISGRCRTRRAASSGPGPPSTPYLVGCGKAADAMQQAGGFGEPETWRFDWSRPYTRDEWLDVVPTFGGHSLLPPQVQAELLAGIGAAVDAAGGAFTLDYATVAATAAREPGASRRTGSPSR